MKNALRICVGLAVLALGVPRAEALTLGEGLAIVSRTGREIGVSAAEEQVLRSAASIAGVPRRPTVDLYARGTLLADQPAAVFGANTVPTAERDFLSWGFRVRQLLYDFGATDAAVRAADLDAETKRLDTAVVGNRASLRFILTYLRLLRVEKLLLLQQEEVDRFEAHRKDTAALLEEGTITENDLLEAEVRLADAVQKRLQAENQRALAVAQVNSLLLRPLGEAVSPEEVALPDPAGDPGLEEALASGARDRLELKVLERRAAAVSARRAGVRTESYPQLYLAGGYDFTENRYQVHEGNWSVLAGVDVNLFSGGLTRERLRQKELELRVLERTREQLLDAVRLEVQEAFLSLGTARSRVAATGKAVRQARENMRLEKQRYVEEVGTSTEVLDAVSLATMAEQNHLNARYDVTEARARLDFAVGKDLAATWSGSASTSDREAVHE